jgi:hypothetical protein
MNPSPDRPTDSLAEWVGHYERVEQRRRARQIPPIKTRWVSPRRRRRRRLAVMAAAAVLGLVALALALW